MSNKTVLILGGEGYIGTIVRDFFLKKKFKVTSVDKLIYNQKYSKVKKNKKLYKFINSNFDSERIIKIISSKKIQNIIILGSIVGDPITKKYPKISKKINIYSTKKVLNNAIKNKIKNIIFVSTCSNYGVVKKNKIANEKTKLDPRSIYAKSKVIIEKYLISKKISKSTQVTILRFATAFGLSKRMRFDLTINQFVREIYYNKKIEVYDPFTWRPYCHVKDFATLFYKIINKKNVKRKQIEIFNSGSSKNNFTKMMIVKKIKKYFSNFKLVIKENSTDPRDYRVDFSKIKKIYNFTPKFSVDSGIIEILKAIKNGKYKRLSSYKDKLGNYKITKNV